MGPIRKNKKKQKKQKKQEKNKSIGIPYKEKEYLPTLFRSVITKKTIRALFLFKRIPYILTNNTTYKYILICKYKFRALSQIIIIWEKRH
jgi:hypothetical protein